jgi:hypothetical protein
MNITCQNCFHKWESKTNEKDKNFCHKCGYDNDKKIIDTEKLKNWIITNQKIVGENQINKIRSFIRKKLLKESNEQETRDFNIKNIGELYKDNATEIFKIIMSFPEIWLEEVGLETLLNFLEKEDSMNFRLQNGITTGNPIIFKSQEMQDSERRRNKEREDYEAKAKAESEKAISIVRTLKVDEEDIEDYLLEIKDELKTSIDISPVVYMNDNIFAEWSKKSRLTGFYKSFSTEHIGNIIPLEKDKAYHMVTIKLHEDNFEEFKNMTNRVMKRVCHAETGLKIVDSGFIEEDPRYHSDYDLTDADFITVACHKQLGSTILRQLSGVEDYGIYVAFLKEN